jgi:hypothetical protein
MKAAAALAILLTAAASPAWAQALARVEVPIRQTVLKDGTPRYSITVSVGAGQVDAMLDTGSTGFRLLPTAVDRSNLKATTTPARTAYGSGAQFTGVIAMAPLSIGGVAGTRPVKVHWIESAGCMDKRPQCPVSRSDAKHYAIGGNGRAGEGYQAILGVNMGVNETENPFVGMGFTRWIIVLPKLGDRAPGRLILNPTDEEAKGFTAFPIEPRFRNQAGAHHDAITACLTNDKTKASVCAPTLLDSGATAVVVMAGRDAPDMDWRPRTPVTLTFKPAQGADVSLSFVTDKDKPSHFTVRPAENAPRTRFVAGSLPFYSFSVLYDAPSGTVGLKPR